MEPLFSRYEKCFFFLVTKVAQLAFHDLKIFTSHRWKTSGSFYESARKDNKFKREDEIIKLKNSHNNRLIKSAESAPPSSAIKEIKRCGILRVSKFIWSCYRNYQVVRRRRTIWDINKVTSCDDEAVNGVDLFIEEFARKCNGDSFEFTTITGQGISFCLLFWQWMFYGRLTSLQTIKLS